jgi:putative ABC transport system ATP-binding protein
MDQGLQVKDLHKTLDGKKIIRGTNFSISPGKILALVGESGSGKTTLLKTINRLIEFDSGSILLKGTSIKNLDPIELRRRVGMVLQSPTMLDGTVKENISYGLKLRNIQNNDRDRLLMAVSDSGLTRKMLKQDARKLSGGEQQRVALARLLVLEPEVLLLDEPTAALDTKLTKKIERTIMELCKNRNLIIIWVTHNLTQARRVSDYIGILRDGKLKIVSNTKSTVNSRSIQTGGCM